MAKRVGQKIKMTSIDELLGVPTITGCDEIEVARIHPFKDHPFKVLDDDKICNGRGIPRGGRKCRT